jgi:hypothetical protein
MLMKRTAAALNFNPTNTVSVPYGMRLEKGAAEGTWKTQRSKGRAEKRKVGTASFVY